MIINKLYSITLPASIVGILFAVILYTVNQGVISMKNVIVPEEYQQVMPYLIVPDAAGFLSFTQKVFGAEEKYKEMRDENTIKHAEIKIGDSVIMFAQSTKEYPPQNAGLFIYVENADAVYQKALDEGAGEIMKPADQPYGRSGGVNDPFGNTWWITSVQ
jgi:PhnB protein